MLDLPLGGVLGFDCVQCLSVEVLVVSGVGSAQVVGLNRILVRFWHLVAEESRRCSSDLFLHTSSSRRSSLSNWYTQKLRLGRAALF